MPTGPTKPTKEELERRMGRVIESLIGVNGHSFWFEELANTTKDMNEDETPMGLVRKIAYYTWQCDIPFPLKPDQATDGFVMSLYDFQRVIRDTPKEDYSG